MKESHKRHLNLFIIIIALLGFIFSSFILIYNKAHGGFLISLFFIILFLEAYILRIRVPEHSPAYQKKSKEEKKREEKTHPFYKAAPISSNFMLTSIMGFLISAFLIIPISLPWGFAFCVVFAIMFISAIISMTTAPVGDDFLRELHMQELAIHEKIHGRKK